MSLGFLQQWTYGFSLSFTKKTRGPLYRPLPVQADEEGLPSWIKARLASPHCWKDLFYYFLLKLPVSFTTFLFSFLAVGISVACCLSILIFYFCPDCIQNGTLCLGSQSYPGIYGRELMKEWTHGTCNSGWHIYRVQDCIGLTILGVPLLYGAIYLSQGLVTLNYRMAQCFISDPTAEGTESLLGYDPKAGMFSGSSSGSLRSEIQKRQEGRKLDLETDRDPPKGGRYLPEFGDSSESD